MPQEDLPSERKVYLFSDVKNHVSNEKLKKMIDISEKLFSISIENKDQVINEITAYVGENKEENYVYIYDLLLYFPTIRSKKEDLFKQILSSILTKCPFFAEIIYENATNYFYESFRTSLYLTYQSTFLSIIKKDRNLYSKLSKLKSLQSLEIIFDNNDDGILNYLSNDDIQSFLDFLSKNPCYNIKSSIGDTPYTMDPLEIYIHPSLLDFALFNGSVKCSKYLLMNGCEFSKYSPQFIIASGKMEIIRIAQQYNLDFNYTILPSILYHHYYISDWLLLNYSCEYLQIFSFISL